MHVYRCIYQISVLYYIFLFTLECVDTSQNNQGHGFTISLRFILYIKFST